MVARNKTWRAGWFDDFGSDPLAPAVCPPLLTNSPLTPDVGRTNAALRGVHTTQPRYTKHDMGELWNAPSASPIYSPRKASQKP
ncbi:hypothetical protein C2845_PM01G41890 [Panicum miliaceum]|uniref:Uncharacterized protein n=1 Tax=Panicum miliaceum TaxID=4540 RepID=A0A3L6TKX4_PANMI|nr:hypothetical protein C2845_PM01G41890 [Panicum miliaceum]